MGNTILLDVTEVAKTAASFHCDTCKAFSTHSCRATPGVNVKMVIQKDPAHNLLGCFEEFKTNNGILCCSKRENIPPES